MATLGIAILFLINFKQLLFFTKPHLSPFVSNTHFFSCTPIKGTFDGNRQFRFQYNYSDQLQQINLSHFVKNDSVGNF